jgi:ATP-dependent DNA ligase
MVGTLCRVSSFRPGCCVEYAVAFQRKKLAAIGVKASFPGTTDFFSVLQNELKGRSTKIVMIAFDLLYLSGYDLRKLPLVERKAHLKKLMAKTDIQFSESFEVDGRDMYQHACSVGAGGRGLQGA